MTIVFGALCTAFFANELFKAMKRNAMTPPIAYREPLDFIHDDHQHKFAEIGISELGFITEQPLKPEIGRFIAKWRHQPAMRKEVKEISLVFGACS